MRAHKKLFYFLIFFIPLNLGKHFVFRFSYVKGLLVDYLIPTIYVTDLLILLLAALFVFDILTIRKQFFKTFKIDPNILRIFSLFLTAVGLSVISSVRFLPAVYTFFILLVHLLLFFYVIYTFSPNVDFSKLAQVFSFLLMPLALLAIFQWIGQGSVFDNYLYFGEQPYSSATIGIAKENISGRAVVPAYGLFRHPNVFGGFLSIVLLWVYYLAQDKKRHMLTFALGAVALFLTFSQVAWGAFVLGALYLHIIKAFGKKGTVFSLVLTFIVMCSSLFLFLIPAESAPTLNIRGRLESSAAHQIKTNYLFGVGPNNSSVVIEEYLDLPVLLRFPQPPHNVFVLTFLENGIFSLIFFIVILGYALYVLLQQGYGVAAFLFVSILQLMLLGSFDHYLLTIQQTQLLFWLTLSMALAYTKK